MSYWIEKYKPKDINDYNNKNYIDLFFQFKNIKNILIYGEPGTGKTTFIDIIIKNYLINGSNDEDLLSLNASDERGIDTVRNKIKSFCKKKTNKNTFKIIVLDECDSLTNDAQMSLRKITEDYKNTKFIFICNYQNNIIKPLLSRCNIIYFKKYTNKYIYDKCIEILNNENILTDDNKEIYNQYIEQLLLYSKQDIRMVINNLQYLTKMDLKNYDENIINNIYGILSKKLLINILNNIHSVINIKDVVKLLSFYNINNIINNILEIILEDDNINNLKKKEIISLLSYIDSIKNKNIDYEIIIYKIIKEYIQIKLN